MEDGVPQPRLEMFRVGSENADETLYATAVPLGMVKNILKEKGLLAAAGDEL